MTITINNKKVKVTPGSTILNIATANKIKIPSLCEHPDLKVQANCRICVVEIKGRDHLETACSTIVEEGMNIQTESERVKKARLLNLELIFAEHSKKCANCTLRYDCELLKLATKYKVKIDRFKDRKGNRKTYKFANAVEIDGTQCIDCKNCISACSDIQNINYLKMAGEGVNQEVVPVKDKNVACIYCGQCALHCPVAASQEQAAWQKVEELIKDKTKIVVAQFAPSIRVSLGEEFAMPYGANCESKIYTALKKLGFNKVFDVNFGADITTMTEAEELLSRLKDKKAVFPMTTSCCPAWVAYAEFYHPELLPNLTTARSPHIHLAGAIKTYWAQKNKVNPKNIIVVSIVPCTAKKYEAAREELGLDGRPLVDLVLTTRELAYMIKKNNIDFKKLADGKGENLFNSGSGAAAIYGASGGVMESALRTANALVCADSKNKLCDCHLEFKEVRGLAGFKEAIVNLDGKKIKVGVVNGIANIERILPKLNKYHYIEVMACPGGCLGGGGQPIPTNKEIRQKRLDGLYAIDKKRPIRRAHENKAMLEYYNWVKKNNLSKQVLHTKFARTTGSILTTKKNGRSSLFDFLF
ncbi:MAG: [FeFe] hydrogenase, group A [Candidatus Falkowbacteria bacterium]